MILFYLLMIQNLSEPRKWKILPRQWNWPLWRSKRPFQKILKCLVQIASRVNWYYRKTLWSSWLLQKLPITLVSYQFSSIFSLGCHCFKISIINCNWHLYFDSYQIGLVRHKRCDFFFFCKTVRFWLAADFLIAKIANTDFDVEVKFRWRLLLLKAQIEMSRVELASPIASERNRLRTYVQRAFFCSLKR